MSSSDSAYNHASEVQEVIVNASANDLTGNFTLTFNDQTTASLPADLSDAGMKTALENLVSVGTVSVSQNAASPFGYAWSITFSTNSGNLPKMVAASINLGGTDIGIFVRETTVGTPSFQTTSLLRVDVTDDDSSVVISSITATDGGSLPGYNDLDTLTVVFGEDTNQPSVSDKTFLDVLFTFSAVLGADYTGTWNQTILPGVVNVTNQYSYIATSEDLTTHIARGQGLMIDGVTYKVDAGNAFSASSLPLNKKYSGITATSLVVYSLSRTTLVITITDTTGAGAYAETKVGLVR
jgi:hypothetical protein